MDRSSRKPLQSDRLDFQDNARVVEWMAVTVGLSKDFREIKPRGGWSETTCIGGACYSRTWITAGAGSGVGIETGASSEALPSPEPP